MGLLDTVNDTLKPGGFEALGRRLANQGLSTVLGDGGPEIVSQNIQDAYGYFLGNLLQTSNTVPVKPLWLCFLDAIPQNIVSKAEELDLNYQAGSHDLSLGFTASQSSIDFRGAKAALLVQECSVPGDSFEVSRNAINGGFLGGGIGAARTPLEPAKIAYLETNYSFTDFVIRPWQIVASYLSLKSAPKVNITMINFAKAGTNAQFKPRKIITLHNCVPISVESEPYTYSGNDIVVREVMWHYDSYTMKSGQLINDNDLLSTLDRVFNTDTLLKTIKSSAISAATGLISNTVTNLVGTSTAAFQGRLQGESNNNNIASVNRTSVALAGSVNVNPSDIPVFNRLNNNDEIIPPKNDHIISNVSFEGGTANRNLNDVVNDQVNIAKNDAEFAQVLPPVNDTPNTLRSYSDDVKINQSDTPVFFTGVKDDHIPNSKDTPETYK